MLHPISVIAKVIGSNGIWLSNPRLFWTLIRGTDGLCWASLTRPYARLNAHLLRLMNYRGLNIIQNESKEYYGSSTYAASVCFLARCSGLEFQLRLGLSTDSTGWWLELRIKWESSITYMISTRWCNEARMYLGCNILCVETTNPASLNHTPEVDREERRPMGLVHAAKVCVGNQKPYSFLYRFIPPCKKAYHWWSRMLHHSHPQRWYCISTSTGIKTMQGWSRGKVCHLSNVLWSWSDLRQSTHLWFDPYQWLLPVTAAPEKQGMRDIHSRMSISIALVHFKVEEGLPHFLGFDRAQHTTFCYAGPSQIPPCSFCLEPLHPSHLGTSMPSIRGLEGWGYASPPAWSLQNATVSYRCCVTASCRQSRIQSATPHSYLLSSASVSWEDICNIYTWFVQTGFCFSMMPRKERKAMQQVYQSIRSRLREWGWAEQERWTPVTRGGRPNYWAHWELRVRR